MDTKLKGDIAEQAVILEALQHGWGVLKPVGDRLAYDLVLDIHGRLVRIQVKSAWLDKASGNYITDIRRTKTNRRVMLRQLYRPEDFDFAVIYLQQLQVFYIFPVSIFTSYKSGIQIVESRKRQRKPRSVDYRDAWNLILQWATRKETSA